MAARDHRFRKSRSPWASQVARRIERRFTRVGDQRPQLFMINSAGKRDTILRPSLSLQPNRESNPCSVRPPTWLRSSGTATESCGSDGLHWSLPFVTPSIMSPRPLQVPPRQWSRPPLRPLLHLSRLCLASFQTVQDLNFLVVVYSLRDL
jgi:hypothetical protein